MPDIFLRLYVNSQSLLLPFIEEDGQDLVEYGLVIVLVCLAATAGMKTLADGINTAMTSISTKLGTYTT
jgi:pilus assembly protein Flp/PilA